MNKLKIIATGGTIDKVYFDDKSDYQIGDPIVSDVLENMNVAFEYEVLPLMKKDSLYITDDDRELIRRLIEKSPERHFLITHGTDTMVETARFLMDSPGKVIALTGALTPARFKDTDAVFNIGCAVGALHSLPEGAWVVMNGKVWDPRQVSKNRRANRFEENGKSEYTG